VRLKRCSGRPSRIWKIFINISEGRVVKLAGRGGSQEKAEDWNIDGLSCCEEVGSTDMDTDVECNISVDKFKAVSS
jgi:hypothetical protein